jgi:elongation factor 1-beta
MALAILKLKIMPTSPEVDLGQMRKALEQKVGEIGAKLHSIEEEPIAFGLVALIVIMAWPEEKGMEEAEAALSGIDGVNSVEVIDYRRAFG